MVNGEKSLSEAAERAKKVCGSRSPDSLPPPNHDPISRSDAQLCRRAFGRGRSSTTTWILLGQATAGPSHRSALVSCDDAGSMPMHAPMEVSII